MASAFTLRQSAVLDL
uniref:Uncharacterized protein n=1 Tax=Anguilla anguilla TaxID=7936 RepID=A0A0E9TN10_ANGAN